MGVLNTERELRAVVNQITQSNLGPLPDGDINTPRDVYHMSFLLYQSVADIVGDCCETMIQYVSSILSVVVGNNKTLNYMKQEQAEMKQKLWLLIAAIERTKKGRL